MRPSPARRAHVEALVTEETTVMVARLGRSLEPRISPEVVERCARETVAKMLPMMPRLTDDEIAAAPERDEDVRDARAYLGPERPAAMLRWGRW